MLVGRKVVAVSISELSYERIHTPLPSGVGAVDVTGIWHPCRLSFVGVLHGAACSLFGLVPRVQS